MDKLGRLLARAAAPALLIVWLIACGGSPTGPTASVAGEGPATLRVVTWNLQHGYTTGRRHANQEQIAFLAGLKPDVVALQELAEWDNDMPTIYRQGLESLTGKRWMWRYEADLPTASASRRDGNVLGTPLPIAGEDVLRLDDPSSPGDNNRNRSVIRFRVSLAGSAVDVATTHLDHLDAGNRRSQVDRMQAWLGRGTVRRIVAGDFNAEPEDAGTWSAWRGEYADAWLSTANPQRGAPGFTMPRRSTTGRPGRVDYQWFRGLEPSRVALVETDLSDHHAVVVDYSIK